MVIISTAMLADLRTRAETTLAHTCTISRPGTPTYDAAGGETPTYTSVASGVACLLRPAGGGDASPIGGAILATATWIVRLPAGTDVRIKDRLLTTVDGETKTLEVLPPVGGPSYELLRVVSCTEIT